MIPVLVVLGFVCSARFAHAQYNVPSQASGESRTMILAGDEPPPPPSAADKLAIGWELGASLDFLTSKPSLGGRELDFTDVVLFRVHGLVALGKHLEIFGGTDLLPKQPSYTNELVWQGAMLGTRYMFDETFSGYARGQLGPGLGRDGKWVVGEAALQYKRDLAEKTLFWESALGGTYTQLFLDPPDTKPFWLTELMAQSGIAIRERKGIFAAWLDFTFHFPLVARPKVGSPDPGRELNPQTRVGVSIGMLVGVTRSLDLFVEWSILDRGDLENQATTLPILSGGFDQRRILFGFNRRFGERRR